jgi:hypothetical protein
MKISTVIPVFIQSEENLLELKATLKSLERQTLHPDEVIISSNNLDQVLNLKMLEVVNEFYLRITVCKNLLGMNAQANTNNGVANAKNEIIHILHHDDPIVEQYAYENISQAFVKGGVKWAIFNVIEKNTISLPKIQPGLIWGFNSIGAPSVLITLKEFYIPFSTDYSYIWDCVNFHEYIERYGNPFFFADLHIATGGGKSRLSGTINEKNKIRDFEMLRSDKYITTKGLLFLILRIRYWDINLKLILIYVSKDRNWPLLFRLCVLFFLLMVFLPIVGIKKIFQKVFAVYVSINN